MSKYHIPTPACENETCVTFKSVWRLHSRKYMKEREREREEKKKKELIFQTKTKLIVISNTLVY